MKKRPLTKTMKNARKAGKVQAARVKGTPPAPSQEVTVYPCTVKVTNLDGTEGVISFFADQANAATLSSLLSHLKNQAGVAATPKVDPTVNQLLHDILAALPVAVIVAVDTLKGNEDLTLAMNRVNQYVLEHDESEPTPAS